MGEVCHTMRQIWARCVTLCAKDGRGVYHTMKGSVTAVTRASTMGSRAGCDKRCQMWQEVEDDNWLNWECWNVTNAEMWQTGTSRGWGSIYIYIYIYIYMCVCVCVCVCVYTDNLYIHNIYIYIYMCIQTENRLLYLTQWQDSHNSLKRDWSDILHSLSPTRGWRIYTHTHIYIYIYIYI